ncbi:predicted protein [Aspergillus terreus NIH2624]|uniref:Uncharacterized protein n=1 Tax=Aspergillus terreus (strain NIH 2624 / FGSC A1156) TaxID=341663 RepID=Q0C8R4_ASPTN|nr:uncharacterized protein ATEG_09920 [Aspergillus terreus NIH2624]EAU30111.1 predicted protein [Aspergillus terreus NIH2624]
MSSFRLVLTVLLLWGPASGLSCPVSTSEAVIHDGTQLSSEDPVYSTPAILVSTVTHRVTVTGVAGTQGGRETGQAGSASAEAHTAATTTAGNRSPVTDPQYKATGHPFVGQETSHVPQTTPIHPLRPHSEPTVEPSIAPDAVFTDSNITIGLYIVDVEEALTSNEAASQSLFQPQSISAKPGDSVLFRFHGPYALYNSDLYSPCHAPRLSQNTVSNAGVSSYQFVVHSAEPV